MATVTHSAVEQFERTGSASMTMVELRAFFDSEACNLLGLSGDQALAVIREGNAGSNLAWAELKLLATLLDQK